MEPSEEVLKETDKESKLVQVQISDFEIAQKRKGRKRNRQLKMQSYVLSHDVYQLDDLLEDLVDFEGES